MAHLSPHLQQIKERAEAFQSSFPLVDNFPPSFSPDDGPEIARLVSQGISYYYTTKVFVKRQPHRDELGTDIFGRPAVNPYIADRLRNEAAALLFVAEHTTIPVPRLLGLWEDDGLVYLKTGLVEAGVELQSLPMSILPDAADAVTAQLESSVLPQLRRLRRNFMGSADPALPVMPPRRVWKWKECREWPSMAKDTDEYVFYHTDLDRQNILVDPDTFEIVCIVDWETSGFFPREWEILHLKANGPQEKLQMSTNAKDGELALFKLFGLTSGAFALDNIVTLMSSSCRMYRFFIVSIQQGCGPIRDLGLGDIQISRRRTAFLLIITIFLPIFGDNPQTEAFPRNRPLLETLGLDPTSHAGFLDILGPVSDQHLTLITTQQKQRKKTYHSSAV